MKKSNWKKIKILKFIMIRHKLLDNKLNLIKIKKKKLLLEIKKKFE